MLSRRGANVLFVLVLSGAMAAIMSLAMTIVHFGVDGHLVSRWLRSLLIAWLIRNTPSAPASCAIAALRSACPASSA